MSSTPDDKTVVIHLRKKFETLPYFVSFSQFSPIPKAKDTKQNYSNHPIATGPYMFKSFTQGTKLELVKNPNWDPAPTRRATSTSTATRSTSASTRSRPSRRSWPATAPTPPR